MSYPKWLREAAARGGKKSRRKLAPKQAREMVKARELKRAARVALPLRTPPREAKRHNDQDQAQPSKRRSENTEK